MTQLASIAQWLVAKPKGILAADESGPTIGKRFAALGIPETEDMRRAWRTLLCTTPGVGDALNGVILFDETARQKTTDGVPFPELLRSEGIIAGIKLDKGTVDLPGFPDEVWTRGLDDLAERLADYAAMHIEFAKWRHVFRITDHSPSATGAHINAVILAMYAAVCQKAGIVPIVEPEVLIDGPHTLEEARKTSALVLDELFEQLRALHVDLSGIVLKPSMVTPGNECSTRATPEEVAEETVKLFREVVPKEVPGIAFLSGGQAPEDATANLNAMNRIPDLPWNLTFSYSRALQGPAMEAWGGKAENIGAGQAAFAKRLRLNSLAVKGEYTPEMEREV